LAGATAGRREGRGGGAGGGGLRARPGARVGRDGHLPAPPRGSRRLRAARLRLRGTLLGPGSCSFVELRLVRLVTPHLDTREDVDAPVVDRALEEEGDVALEAAGVRVAPLGGQEPRVERLRGGGARAIAVSPSGCRARRRFRALSAAAVAPKCWMMPERRIGLPPPRSASSRSLSAALPASRSMRLGSGPGVAR